MWGEDDEEAIAVGILRSNFEGAGIAIGIGVAENVDWIVMTPVSGKERIKLLQAPGRKHGQFAAIGHQRISSQDCRAAGIGEDGKPGAFGARLSAEDLRHIEEVSDVVNPQNAGAAEGGVEDFVAAGKRAGVGGCGA